MPKRSLKQALTYDVNSRLAARALWAFTGLIEESDRECSVTLWQKQIQALKWKQSFRAGPLLGQEYLLQRRYDPSTTFFIHVSDSLAFSFP